jgi:adenylosuccinate synthase
MLQQYYDAEAVDYSETLDQWLEMAKRIKPLVIDAPGYLDELRAGGANLLFEGAQGTLLDIDHGTYPFVTSSNTTAGAAATGSGIGPSALDYVLGIVKAYTTRVGAGPFPTELFDDDGAHLARVGAEFGATTGRARRCGWFDAVALRRSIINSSISGLCVTKLDVLDDLASIQICVGYKIDGKPIAGLPVVVDRFAQCEPVYEEWPGWQESTVGVTNYDDLPQKARDYLARIEELAGVPVDIISTGADREQTIIKTHPFG